MLLVSGKVLFAGGFANNEYLASAELYDAATGAFEKTGSLTAGVAHQSAARLLDGRVLVVAGCGSATTSGYFATAQVYDPQRGRFEETGGLAQEACCNTAVTLRNGKVLVAGGDYGKGRLASAQLFDPATGKFEKTGSLSRPNSSYSATVLPDGKVLIAGGWDGEPLDTMEIYDPKKGTFRTVGRLGEPRAGHTATLLADGRVLFTGGQNHRGVLASASVYRLATR